MMQNILCATDGSRVSEHAVQYAAKMAKEVGAKLTVITISRVSSESASRTGFWDNNVLGAADIQLHAELAEAERMAKEAGVEDLDCVIAYGSDAAEALVAYAKEKNHDHIVTGSHGHTGLGRVVLGSVAADVVAKAHCPVTVVR